MKTFFATTALVTCLASCATTTTQVNFICDQSDIEIYINDEYAGRNQVSCTLPPKTEYVTVSCRREGNEVYSRRFYIKGKKEATYELTIPNNYRYSDGGKIYR